MKRALASAVAAVLVFLTCTAAADAQVAPADPVAPAPAGPGADAGAADAPPEVPEAPPIPDPSPQVAVVLAQLHVLDTQKALADAAVVLTAAKTNEARATQVRDAARRVRDERKAVLSAAVADAYVRGGSDESFDRDVTPAEYMPMASARVLAGSALERAQRLVREADDALERAQRAMDAAVAVSAQASAWRDAAQAAQAEAELAVSNARRLTNRTDVSPSVLGDAVLTADEIVGWYRAQTVSGYAVSVDLPTLASYYIDEGAAEGIRGDIAFAQSMVETGSFTSPLTTHNNFAGIGACDSCETGFDFPSPRAGVRAQAQLLHAYADRTLRLATLANPAVGSNPDNLSVRGCCATWNKLTGTWATDPNYGPKIMTIYLSMLQYALHTRPTPPTNSGPLSTP
jgi:hypothetical protein